MVEWYNKGLVDPLIVLMFDKMYRSFFMFAEEPEHDIIIGIQELVEVDEKSDFDL
jgi:hypothetical protein